MSKMKRAVAIALAAAMTMGSTLTVFAAETTGSGETHGTGQNEGHVDKELINVILPTMPEEGSPFDYVTDPEGLIQATGGAAYEDYTFPSKDGDTGVYFRVGEKKFANESEALQVINKSSCNVTITMTAQATAVGDKDLALASTKEGMSATAPLYLHLKVGTTTDQAITSGSAEVKKTLAGDENNFEIKYVDGAYQYVTKEEAYSWQSLKFSLAGEVFGGDVAADATAPTIDVTWAFAKAGDSDTVSDDDQEAYEETAAPGIVSISDFVKTDPQDVVIKFSLGKGPSVFKANGATVSQGENKAALSASKYTVDMINKTVTIDGTCGFLVNATADVPIYVILTNGTSTKTVTGKIAIKDDYEPVDPEIISITTYEKAKQNNVVVTFSLGSGSLAVDADGVTLYQGETKGTTNASKYAVDMVNKTVTIDGDCGFLKNATANVPIYIALTKDGSEVKELTGTIIVK